MPNGKPGDHPLTDILIHKLTVFGHEIDQLIIEINRLGGHNELDRIEWFPKPPQDLKETLIALHTKLLADAKSRGWEV